MVNKSIQKMLKLTRFEHSILRRWMQSLLLNANVVLIVFFTFLGFWLVQDLQSEYNKTLADKSQSAMQQSQVISQSIYSKILATDYVLRDVLGRVQKEDLVYPNPDKLRFQRMTTLLKEKAATVPDFFSMVIFDKDCVFTATATGRHAGVKSNPELCEARKQHGDNGPLVTYVSGAKAAAGQPVIVLSRHLVGSDGSFQGGVLAVVKLKTIQYWLESLDLGIGDSVSFIDKDQVLLARKPMVPTAIEKPTFTPDVNLLLQDKSLKAYSATRFDVDGYERILGISKIDGFPFFVAYGFEKAKMVERWQRRAIELGVGFILLVLLAFWAAWSQRKTEQAKLRFEIERSRLGERELLLQDMHDGFGSQLASASLMAEHGQMDQDQVKQILQECMADLYLVMDTLSSEDNTLTDAMVDFRYRLQRRLEAIPVSVHWLVELDQWPIQSPRVVLQILRVIQEALSNALKHAQPENIWIELRYLASEEILHVNVSDDGLGLPSSLINGRGLSGMQGRARAIGAQLLVRPNTKGRGVDVSLTLKLSATS